jgi:hypothetical protein
MPTPVLHNKSPFECLLCQPPNWFFTYFQMSMFSLPSTL